MVLLSNNGVCGAIRQHQVREYPARVSGSGLQSPDFCALARACGYAAEHLTHTAEFEPALLRALASDGGTLLEVVLDPKVLTTRATLSAIRHRVR